MDEEETMELNDQSESGEISDTNNSDVDSDITESQSAPVDTIKELYYVCDHDYIKRNEGIQNKKITKKLKLTTIKTMFNCSICGYLTMNREFLRLHKCEKTKKVTNEIKFSVTINKQATSERKQATNEKKLVTDENRHTANEKQITNDRIQATNENRQSTNENKQVTNEKNLAQCYNKLSIDEIVNATTEDTLNEKTTMHLKCTECPFRGKDKKGLMDHYNEAFYGKCHCGYDIHMKYKMVSHKRIHSVTMIVLPNFL